MPSSIITADLHFGKSSATPGVVLKTALGILDICKANDIRLLRILGDLLDNQTIISHRILAEEIGFFLQTADSLGILVEILHGNHDGRDMVERKTSNLKHLNLYGARLIDTIQYQGNILWVPWLYKGEKLEVTKDAVLLAHLALNGFSFNNGPQVESDGIDTTSIPNRIYTGHFHGFQTIGNKTYVGSPLQHSFSDADTPKFVHILDDKLDLVESISTMHLFPNYINLDMNKPDVNVSIPPGCKIKVINVDPLDIEIMEKGLLETGARTVEIHTIDKEFEEIEEAVYSSLTIEDAIVEIINSKEEEARVDLTSIHLNLVEKATQLQVTR